MQECAMQHAVVSQTEWLAARKALLAKEKEFTKARDALSAARRELPWVKVDKNYVFDGPDGKRIARRPVRRHAASSSSITSCSARTGSRAARAARISPIISTARSSHLAQRDVTMLAVSRAPLAEIEAFKKRMGWTFKWVSSYGNDFNHDFHVSFTQGRDGSGKADIDCDRR